MNLKSVVSHYSRPDVAEALLAFARDREVVGKTPDGSFLSRPNVLVYPADIIHSVEHGVTSFHASVERWKNPMRLETGLRPSELDDLRIGWDMILDIDCKIWQHSRIAAHLLIQALKAHGIKSISVKFSGGSGFHIAVPFEALPKEVAGVPTVRRFPELPRLLAAFLKEFIRDRLAEELLVFEGSPQAFAKATGKPLKEIAPAGRFNPYASLEIDTVLISPRHLLRMPLSFHEKSGLVSVPLALADLKKFELEMAKPAAARTRPEFCSRDVAVEGKELIEAALAWSSALPKRSSVISSFPTLTGKIPESAFPPCIKNLLATPLEDGRKRAEFLLRTFLRRAGWGWEEIEQKMKEWNARNKVPLPDRYLAGQLNWHKKQNHVIMPPNCASPAYYLDLKFCTPEDACRGLKNPISIAFRKSRRPKS